MRLYTLFTCAHALQVFELAVKRRSEPQVETANARLDVTRHQNINPQLHQIHTDGTVTVDLENLQFYYEVELDIGTPAQRVKFTIDTGSADLWVTDSTDIFCYESNNTNATANCSNCLFNSKASRTFYNLSAPFDIGYGDTTGAQGYLGQDVVEFGGVKISNATFGVATRSNSSSCVFGIGFDQNEAISEIHHNGSGAYPSYFNIPTMLKKQGIIRENVYSLWLNGPNDQAGSILFGGIDHAKYEGELAVMPILNFYSKYVDMPTQMRVMLNSVRQLDPNGIESPVANFNASVLLDSGTSLAYLPGEIVAGIAQRYGYQWSDDIGFYVGNCAAANDTVGSFILDFSGARVPVSASNLVLGLTSDTNDSVPLSINGQDQCILAMGNASDSYAYILGDVFLRSMYTVYDLDTYQIGLAPARNGLIDESDIKIIYGGIREGRLAPGYTKTSTGAAIATFRAPNWNQTTVRTTATDLSIATSIHTEYITNTTTITAMATRW